MTARAGRTQAVRLPLTVSVIALCGLGTLALLGSEHFVPAFATAFWIAAALRLILAHGGRSLLPRKLLVPLGYTVAAAACGYLFQRLGRPGADSLWTLMCVTAVFQGLVLLWRQTTFSSFLLILFSSVHAAGIPFAHGDAAGLAYIAGYVTLLVWTLILFERRAALDREEISDGSVQYVRAAAGRALPWWTAVRTGLVLVVVGLPLGAALYLAAPRGWSLGDPLRSEAERADPGGTISREGFALGEAATERTEFAFAGPGGEGAPLGSVAEIKKNFEPWFEVALAEGGMPPLVVLRDNTLDYYDAGRHMFTDTVRREGRATVYRDIDDGRRDGWIPLEYAGRGRQDGVTLRIEMLRGGQTRLYHQPDEVGLEIQRDGKPLPRVTVIEKEGKELDASKPLKAGDIVLQRYVPPQAYDRALIGRRSDSSVVPRTSYLQLPRLLGRALEARARTVVGGETDPWRRARLLERWLKSEAFTYSLRIPPLDPRKPVLDFLERTRKGNCEFFAYSLTLMLRALGHPARYVRGFWGGDRQEQRKTVILRGVHYHAWTEMYLAGAGWIPLNPTPPDRRAVDADTLTAAQEAWEQGRTEEQESWSFLGYDQEGWRAFWRGAAGWCNTWLLQPVAILFSSRGGYSGIPLALLLIVLIRRGRERRRLQALVVAPGRKLPAGAYGQALLLLARRGIRRRPHQTVREHLRSVAARIPEAVPALGRLTVLHEARTYGGREPALLRAEAGKRLEELRRALKPRQP